MKKLVFLLVLALELALCGCGTHTIANTVPSTTTSGSWEAQVTGGTDQASLLNFVTAFSLNNNNTVTSGPLTITGFGFINAGKCFANGINGSTETGNATLVTNTADQVTGNLSFKIVSVTPAGNTLSMTGNLTGTSSGTRSCRGYLDLVRRCGRSQLFGAPARRQFHHVSGDQHLHTSVANPVIRSRSGGPM